MNFHFALSTFTLFGLVLNISAAMFDIINLRIAVAYDLQKEQTLQDFQKGIKAAS